MREYDYWHKEEDWKGYIFNIHNKSDNRLRILIYLPYLFECGIDVNGETIEKFSHLLNPLESLISELKKWSKEDREHIIKRIIIYVDKYKNPKAAKGILEELDSNISSNPSNPCWYDPFLHCRLRSVDDFDKVLDILESDEVVKVLDGHVGEEGKYIASYFTRLVCCSKNQPIALEALKTIKNHDTYAAYGIIEELSIAAEQPFSLKTVKEISKMLRSAEITNLLQHYSENNIRLRVADEIARLARGLVGIEREKKGCIGDLCIEFHENKGRVNIADKVGYRLRKNVDKLKDLLEKRAIKRDFVEISKVVGKFEGEDAVMAAEVLSHAPLSLKDRSKVVRLAKMIERVGDISYMLELLDEEEGRLYDIVRLGLDGLVKDRKTFEHVGVYILSRGELPLPTKDNIEDYLYYVLDHLRSEYGLKRDISLNQIAMLFRIDKDIRKDVIKLVNKSEEVRPKYYILSQKKDSSGKEIVSNIVRAVESKNPLDYDGKKFGIVLYLPFKDEINRGILSYCEDEKIGLIKYELNNQTVAGVVYCLEDKELLVDRIEISKKLKEGIVEKMFDIIFEDIMGRAKDMGVSRVILNPEACFRYSTKFEEYIGEKKLHKEGIRMQLNTKAYLNSKKRKEGYVVEVG